MEWSGVVTMCQAWLTADFLPIYHEAREGRESLDHRRRGGVITTTTNLGNI